MSRLLDIGPIGRMDGWETLDARDGFDIKADASEPLTMIPDGTYAIVHSSHVIEHIPWWKTQATLKEWVRILAPGGRLECWTMNALLVAKFLIATEEGLDVKQPDRWNRYGCRSNPYRWAAGRIFSYDKYDPWSWHRALMTPRYLKQLFEEAGLVNVRDLPKEARRGHNHGAINMGVIGTKPGASDLDQYTAQDVLNEKPATQPDSRSTQPSSEHQSLAEPTVSFFELPSQD